MNYILFSITTLIFIAIVVVMHCQLRRSDKQFIEAIRQCEQAIEICNKWEQIAKTWEETSRKWEALAREIRVVK